MKAKKLIVPVLLVGFVFSLLLSSNLVAAKSQQDKKEAEKTFIPKEIKTVLQQGLAGRQGRQDVPFTFLKQFYLPARDNAVQNIFIFKIKNSSFAFVPAAPAEKKQEPTKEETPATTSAPAPTQLISTADIFLQFNRLENNKTQIYKEAGIYANLQADSASYDPEKEEIYSIGYPLPPGNYLLAMAITSMDLKKIGSFYHEFSIPDMSASTQEIETTPIFFAKEIKQTANPETTLQIHKDFFAYSVLQVKPNLDNIISPGESLDIFFFIYGAKPSAANPGERQQFNIEINYEVKKGEELVVRFEPSAYTTPFISHPLPMKQPVVTKSEKGEEKKERKDLEPGTYSLNIKITDKNSEKTLTKKIDFEVK